MIKGLKNEKLSGRNFALTIILGVFIAIMVIVLINLTVSYIYEGPKYENYCKGVDMGAEAYPIKAGINSCLNCTYSKALQEKVDACTEENGIPVYEYNDVGCTKDLKSCDLCQKNFDGDMKAYNRRVFFIFAAIGFILIIGGLFLSQLLLQLVTLPAGASLVIEAAMRNFDNKLLVIITFALLIILAIVLALRKLK
ncbi:MAG: hypothetical protein NT076_05180 [Candidatus Pacearchaeota archaeon]|nr:hypothetical protein [Candidatus Pacearchaeota archaeon]